MRELINPPRAVVSHRTKVGNLVYATGVVLAAYFALCAVSYAIVWQDHYGALAMLSGCLHAMAVYLVGRAIRQFTKLERRQIPGV